MYLNNSNDRNRRRQGDPFRQFLFGNHSAQPHGQNDYQQETEKKSNPPTHNYSPQRNRGSKQMSRQNETASALINPASVEKYLNNLDVDLLYENIDLLMKTAEQFKPLYNELNPIIMKFLKRK